MIKVGNLLFKNATETTECALPAIMVALALASEIVPTSPSMVRSSLCGAKCCLRLGGPVWITTVLYGSSLDSDDKQARHSDARSEGFNLCASFVQCVFFFQEGGKSGTSSIATGKEKETRGRFTLPQALGPTSQQFLGNRPALSLNVSQEGDDMRCHFYGEPDGDAYAF